MTSPLWQKVKKNERASWRKWKRREKSWLKAQYSKNWDHGIWSHRFMAKDGETMKIVTDFILWGSKITADGVCTHDIKRRLLLGGKAMTNLVSILKSRDITDKGPSSQSYGFSSSHVWTWEDYKENWAPKNWCFWTVVLEKTLESPLDCKEIQPVHPKGNQSEYLLEGLMLKLKLQYFGHLIRRANSLEKTPMLGKIEGGRRGRQRTRWLDGITDLMDVSLSMA